jgi:hypothetical protein
MEQLINILVNFALFSALIEAALHVLVFITLAVIVVLLGGNPRRHFDRSIMGKKRPYR